MPRTSVKTKRFHRAANPRRLVTTERDELVCKAVARHRYLSGKQLRQLVFVKSSASAATPCLIAEALVRRRLRRLFDHAYLDRLCVVAQPTRGIPPFVYQLGPRGIEYLKQHNVVVPPHCLRPPGPYFIRHHTVLIDFYISLIQATRGTPLEVSEWLHEGEIARRTTDSNGEPLAITISYSASKREAQTTITKSLKIRPDAFFKLIGPDQHFAFFVEVDLATHGSDVWRQRALLYATYATLGQGQGQGSTTYFQRHFGRQSFRLLTVTTPDYRGRSRATNILRLIRSMIGPSELFLVTTLPQLRPERILQRVWRCPGIDQLYSLVHTPAGLS